MTHDEGVEVAKLKDAIWEAVHELVDTMTRKVRPEIDEAVRQQLTEQFRFWRK